MINVSISSFIITDEGKFVNLGQVENFTISDLVVTQEFRGPGLPEKVTKQINFYMVSGEIHIVSMTEKAVENFLRNGICLIGKK